MIIAVASGKGGTGKTTIAINLALSLENVHFLDCDVEEPNAHIFLKPEITHAEWVNIPVPKVNEDRCTYCGKCAEICAYNAIAVIKEKVLLFSELCHGCGGCSLLCPEDAIEEIDRPIGMLEKGKANSILFTHGKLNLGEALAVPLVRAVKRAIPEINPNNNQTISNNELTPSPFPLPCGERIKVRGKRKSLDYQVTIIDVPPGTSCPVIESVKKSDFCLLVTEPTPFGLNDLILAAETLKKLRIPFGVVINRADVGDKKTDEYCEKEKITILMRIPMDRDIAIAYSQGIPMVEAKPEYKKKFLNLYKKMKELTGG